VKSIGITMFGVVCIWANNYRDPVSALLCCRSLMSGSWNLGAQFSGDLSCTNYIYLTRRAPTLLSESVVHLPFSVLLLLCSCREQIFFHRHALDIPCKVVWIAEHWISHFHQRGHYQDFALLGLWLPHIVSLQSLRAAWRPWIAERHKGIAPQHPPFSFSGNPGLVSVP